VQVKVRRNIKLLDVRDLVELWIRHTAKIDASKRSLLPLRPIYFIAPMEPEKIAPQTKPAVVALHAQ
jgi:hypothetical protein